MLIFHREYKGSGPGVSIRFLSILAQVGPPLGGFRWKYDGFEGLEMQNVDISSGM